MPTGARCAWCRRRTMRRSTAIRASCGTLTTVGSAAVNGYYEKLRLVGAQARKVMIACAAQKLKVPADELSTEPGAVIHKKSGRSIDLWRDRQDRDDARSAARGRPRRI